MTRKKNKTDGIAEIYFNTKHSGGFTGKRKLQRALKNKIPYRQVSDWLEHTDTYTLHKPAKRSFKRRSYVVTGLNHLLQMDLAVFSQFSKYNNQYKYILLIIDVFSKKAYGIPLKTKSGTEVSNAIDHFLSDHKKDILYVQTDKGSEFLNSLTQKVFKKHKVKHYTYTNQEIKASFVERFTRTLKQKIYRYFTHTNGYRYIDALPHLMHSYNSSIHSSHGKAPNTVNHKNQEEVWQKLYNTDQPLDKINGKPTFKVGDQVRISKYSTVFAKGYLPAWTEEIFTIAEVHGTNPPVYSIADDHGDKLTGTWYKEELQKVKIRNSTYKVEAILGQRKVNNKIQYLVKWLGYDNSFNSYINKSDLIQNYKN